MKKITSKKMGCLLLAGFVAVCFAVTGCGVQFSQEPLFGSSKTEVSAAEKARSLSLACWNAQTFFDAVTDGSEYTDFKNASKWTKDKYVRRLEKLCEVMTILNADVLVLEEIENEAVVQDIVNRLASGAWNRKKSWQYACFAKEPGSAIGCAVFSRYELINICVHSMDIQIHKEAQPSSRPIMQMTVLVGDKDFTLFVNHWKSKSGGEEETEIWRDWQELVLADNVLLKQSEGKAVVIPADVQFDIVQKTLFPSVQIIRMREEISCCAGPRVRR